MIVAFDILVGLSYYSILEQGFEFHFLDTGRLEDKVKNWLLANFDAVADTIWSDDPPRYSAQPVNVFGPNTQVVCIVGEQKLAGFSVYKIVPGRAGTSLFRYATLIRPEYWNAGLYGRLTTEILKREIAAHDVVFYAWRTRNPHVWFSSARRCDKVLPNFEGSWADDLWETAAHVAGVVYPGKPLDRDTMTMRNAFSPTSVIAHLPRHRDEAVNASFYAHEALKRPEDAIFSLGRLCKAEQSHERS